MAYLILKSETRGDVKLALSDTPIFIGRSPDKDVCLRDDLTVSNSHAKITCENGVYRLKDLQSTNGTFVNGEQVGEKVLKSSDEITIGNTVLIFSEPKETTLKPDTPRSGAIASDQEMALADLFENTVSIPIEEIESDIIAPKAIAEAVSVAPSEVRALQNKIAVLYKLGQQTTRLERLDSFLPRLAKLVQEAVNGERVYILLIDSATGDLVPRAHIGRGKQDKQSCSTTILNRVLSERKAVLSQDAFSDPRFHHGESIALYRIRGVMCVPLGVKQAVYGAIYVDSISKPANFTADDLRLLGIIANQASIILRNIQLFEDVKRTHPELVQAREEILPWNRELERKVEERTAEIRKASEEIKQLAEMKDELLGIAAHDLRTPLTIIHGYAQLQLMSLESDPAVDSPQLLDDLRAIERTSLEMTTLLNDLLDVSKIEAGKIRIQPELVDPAELLLDCYRLHQHWAKTKAIDLKVDVPPGLPRVHVDPKRLPQVHTNHASNALKYSREGDSIVLSIARGDGRVDFSVRDTGQGIAPEDLPRIFGRFDQLPSSRATKGEKGSGLGLAIAKKLVELHGGRIWVESVQGRGSHFTFSIPLQAGPATHPSSGRPVELAAGPAVAARGEAADRPGRTSPA